MDSKRYLKDVTPLDARTVAIMYDLREKYHGAACEPIGLWLVSRAKRTWPLFAGFRFFLATNVRRAWVLVSYHHPAQLCWMWAVWFTLFPRPYGKWIGRGFGQVWLKIPYLFEVRIHRQHRSAWMLSGAAQQRLKAIAAKYDEGAAA